MHSLHSSKKEVFYTLDALRGLAAICVMIYHYSEWLSPKTVMASSYLAVDFFFLLSGFVIAHAYNNRLATGMKLAQFIRLRLTRLFPLYIVCSALGLLYVVIRMRLEPGKHINPSDLGRASFLSALMLPQMSKSSLSGLFPFDPAAWSLFFEVIANVVYAALFRFVTTLRLFVVVGASAIALGLIAYSHGSLDVGMLQATFWGGAIRCTFGFTLGIVLYRFRPKALIAPPEIGLYLAFLVFITHPSLSHRGAYDLIAVLIVFPALLMISTHTDVGVRKYAFEFAALLSYPLYLLHTPLLLIGLGFYKAVVHADPIFARPTVGIGLMILVLAAAYVMARWVDQPLRALLGSKRFKHRIRYPGGHETYVKP